MATKTNTYSPGQIDVNNFVLGDVKTNDYGGKFVNILYKDNERGANHVPYIRTGDYMRMPFGLSETSFDDNTAPKCSVNVDFTGKDTNEKIMDTANLFTNLDKLMLKWGEENCKSWFKKQCSAEVINDKYSSMIKIPRDKDGEVNEKYENSIRFNLSKDKHTDKITTKIFDHKKKLVDNPREYIKARMSARLVVKPKFIWVNPSGFGLSWEVTQMKLSEPINEDECAFTDESDVEDSENDAVADEDVADDDNEEIFNFDSQANEIEVTQETNDDAPDENVEEVHEEKPKKKGGRKKKN